MSRASGESATIDVPISRLILARKNVDQLRDVAAPLAQRRHLHRHDVEAEEEILAEALLLHGAVERLVGGGEDAAVDLDHLACRRGASPRAPAARAAAWPAARAACRRSRRAAACRPAASSNLPARCSVAPVNAPRSWPNSSLSSSSRGIAEQLMRDERPAPARRVVVDDLGDELLAGAALALDEHRRVGIRDAADRLVDLLHRRAVADDRDADLEAAAQLAFETVQVGGQTRHLQGAAGDGAHLVDVERLGDVIVGAALHRVDGVVHRVLRRDDDDRRRRRPLRAPASARTGRRDRACACRRRRGRSTRRCSRASASRPPFALHDGMPGALQRLHQHPADGVFVVRHQDRAVQGVRAHASATGRVTVDDRTDRMVGGGADDAAVLGDDACARSPARGRCRAAWW